MPAEYLEHAASTAHRPFVECFWTLRASGRIAAHAVMPDGCIDLLYSTRSGLRVVGTMSQRLDFTLDQDEELAGVRFHPGAAPRFLGCSPRELCDRTESLASLWGSRGGELQSRLDDAASSPARIATLRASLAEAQRPKSPVEAALDALRQSHGAVELDVLAEQAGLSARQLRRSVAAVCGVGPKHLARILRFRRALGLAPRLGWAAVAAECGYSDQAHLIHDFHQLAGCTPSAVSVSSNP